MDDDLDILGQRLRNCIAAAQRRLAEDADNRRALLRLLALLASAADELDLLGRARPVDHAAPEP